MSNLKYKVGDKVRIKSLDWYNENKDEDGDIEFEEFRFVSQMSKFCGKILTIDVDFEDGTYLMKEDNDGFVFTKEMIEGLVGDETKPETKFKVGDKVITDTNMKGKIIEVVEEGWYRVEFEPHNKIPQPNGVVPEESMSLMEEKCNCVQVDNIPDVIQAKTSSACSHNGFYGYSDSEGNETSEWYLPEGYQFTDENGNVINATKIVLEKKKKEYPKTYEECCKVFGLNHYLGLGWNSYDEYSGVITCLPKRIEDITKKLESLSKLIICRDAYWKIVGEEMGLSGSWKPDFASCKIKYAITYYNNVVSRYSEVDYNSTILVFPTEEMRDAFYEAFKEDIEYCKELL